MASGWHMTGTTKEGLLEDPDAMVDKTFSAFEIQNS
jgi:hypothetical protein